MRAQKVGGTTVAVLACTCASAAEAVEPAGSVTVALVVLFGLLSLVLALRRRALSIQIREITALFRAAKLPSSMPSVERAPADRIAHSLSSCRAALDYAAAGQAEEFSRRTTAEASLRQLEERYQLAVRCADDAVWEWDLKTDRAQFSVRWKSLLGYADHELGDSIEEWTQRVHPEDAERVLQELREHLEQRSVRFESEHRLQHRDETWRWVHTRGSVVRDDVGEPSRLIGLVTDISARKDLEGSLVQIAEGLSSVRGDECLRQLVHTFAETLKVREAFVCECSDYPATRVRMLARWKAGAFARCVEFDLTGTACEDVICKGRTVFTARDAGERWPIEKQYERESYLGIPCLDSSGRVIGHIACADDRPMRDELPHQAILKIFAMRASIELERAALNREQPGALDDPA